jgi:hypothetical protein
MGKKNRLNKNYRQQIAWTLSRHDTPNHEPSDDLIALFGPNDLDRIVPTEQTDFGNVGPMAGLFPQRFATVWTAWGGGNLALGEFLLERWIGPNRFAIIAQDTTGQSASARILADSHSTESVPANRAMLDIDQKRLGHR